MARKSKTELIETLRQLLGDAFHLREVGGAYPRLARAQGYADGYMRALMELGVADQRELLRLVGEERRRTCGAPTREYETDDVSAVA